MFGRTVFIVYPWLQEGGIFQSESTYFCYFSIKHIMWAHIKSILMGTRNMFLGKKNKKKYLSSYPSYLELYYQENIIYFSIHLLHLNEMSKPFCEGKHSKNSLIWNFHVCPILILPGVPQSLRTLTMLLINHILSDYEYTKLAQFPHFVKHLLRHVLTMQICFCWQNKLSCHLVPNKT